MNPITRNEKFLAKISGEKVDTPTPVTRVEKYLDRIAKGTSDVNAEIADHEQRITRLEGLFPDTVVYGFHVDPNESDPSAAVTYLYARQMLTYIGWIDFTNCYSYYCKHIKSCINIRSLKKIISNHDRRRNLCGINQSQTLNRS